MNLFTYIQDMDRRQALAEAVETSPSYLWQIATRWRGRRPSPEFAKRIEMKTRELGHGVVTKESLIFGPAPSAAYRGAKYKRKEVQNEAGI